MRRLATICVLAVGLISGGVRGEGILYVDDDAPAGGDGLSWATAFSDLHDALAAARMKDSGVTEIRIGQGVYKPTVPFALVGGVTLVGGFAGVGSDDPDVRDFESFGTILSGDKNGDSVWSDCCELTLDRREGCSDNTCEQAVCSQLPECCSIEWDAQCQNRAQSICAICDTREDDISTVLIAFGKEMPFEIDGLSVQWGNNILDGGGLGVRFSTSITVRNCVFKNNQARFGGGLHADFASQVEIESCVFEDNVALSGGNGNGGGVYIEQGEIHINNTLFRRNSAFATGGGAFLFSSIGSIVASNFEHNQSLLFNGGRGGGLRVLRGIPGPIVPDPHVLVGDCIFQENQAAFPFSAGGGVAISRMPTTIDRCRFFGNMAYDGSAIGVRQADVNISSCIMSGNANQSRGTIQNSGGNVRLFNSVITHNASEVLDGAGVCASSDGQLIVDSSTVAFNGLGKQGGIHPCSFGNSLNGEVTVINAVVWGNTNEGGGVKEIEVFGSEPVIRHSCVEGLPSLFEGSGNTNLDPLFRDPLGLDGIAGTEDDDFRLSPGSPCLDAGDNSVLEAEDLVDLDGRARRIDSPLSPDVGVGDGAIVDMGAFEFQAGDVNDDFVVSLADFEGWKGCVAEPSGVNCLMLGFDGDGDVDLVDWSGLQVAFGGE